MQMVTIKNEVERAAAAKRSLELTTGPSHSADEQREIEALAEAIEAYDVVDHAVGAA